MNTKLVQSLVIAGILGLASTQSNAITYDFVNLIDTNNGTINGTLGNGGAFSGNPGEAGFQTFDWTKGGLTLTATGTNSGAPAFSYLDAGNAGLGVCSAINAGNQCNPSSDDNVTVGETLKLHFDKVADIDFSSVIFRDASHNIFSPLIQISVDGGGFSALNLTSMLQGTDFEFRTLDQTNQFYINVLSAEIGVPPAETPIPGTLVLMALGLLGVGITRRK